MAAMAKFYEVLTSDHHCSNASSNSSEKPNFILVMAGWFLLEIFHIHPTG